MSGTTRRLVERDLRRTKDCPVCGEPGHVVGRDAVCESRHCPRDVWRWSDE